MSLSSKAGKPGRPIRVGVTHRLVGALETPPNISSYGYICYNKVSKPLILQLQLRTRSTCWSTSGLLDTGANACFIQDCEFARVSNIPTIALQHAVIVEAVDGRELSSGAITIYIVPLEVYVQETLCAISFSFISSPLAPIILGLPWLKLLNPKLIGYLDL
jgi:hypothetical protein